MIIVLMHQLKVFGVHIMMILELKSVILVCLVSLLAPHHYPAVILSLSRVLTPQSELEIIMTTIN